MIEKMYDFDTDKFEDVEITPNREFDSTAMAIEITAVIEKYGFKAVHDLRNEKIVAENKWTVNDVTIIRHPSKGRDGKWSRWTRLQVLMKDK